VRRLRRWWWPLLAVVVWMAGTAVGGPFFGRLGEVQSQTPTDFLPSSAESTRALLLQGAFSDDVAPPAIVVVTADGGLSPAALEAVAARLTAVGDLDGVAAASPPIPARELGAAGGPLAVQAFVAISGETAEVVGEIRAELRDLPEGVVAYVTGPAGFVADLVESFGEIDGILLVVTVVAVLAHPPRRLPESGPADRGAAVGDRGALRGGRRRLPHGEAGWIRLNGQAQGILFILVIGAATDYALLLVSRFREALRAHADVLDRDPAAWRGRSSRSSRPAAR
jgi:putative drug exporter of the RND superfamily